MAYKNRFHKTTLGVDAQVLVGKAVAYSDDATFAAFVANAVEGEMAIVKVSDNSIPANADGALAAGTEVFIALKRDGAVETTLPFKVGQVTKSAYSAPAKHKITVTSGLSTVAKGDILEIAVIETTPGMQPLPTSNYSVEVKASETAAQAVGRLIALINDAQSIENRSRQTVVTATVASSVNIVLDAIRFGEHFTVALRGKLAEAGSFAVTTQFKQGSGTPEQALLAEQAGDIRKGVTTNYPDQNATPEEFGKPTSFVGSTTQYLTLVVKHFTEDTTRTLDKEFRKSYAFIYAPSNGAANPATELATILGV